MNIKELGAEFIGTFWLVLGGCGAAVFAAARFADAGEAGGAVNMGIGYLGVSLAFGLTVFTGAYALGHISGGHFNPAVTLGLIMGGRFNPAKAVGYVIAQVAGAIVAALIIYLIASGQDGWEIGEGPGAFASNGYGEFSPHGFNLGAAFIAEVVLTAIFLIVILGATAKNAAAGAAGAAIGLCLTLIHLVSIPVTNTSVNPARSTSQAIFAGGDELAQLWMFWVAPLIGAALGGLIYRGLLGNEEDITV